jgi:soluble lytic murein transglycosylase-like protein
MITNTYKYIGIIGLTCILTIGALLLGGYINKEYEDYKYKCSQFDNVHSELNYYKEAEEINDYYARFNVTTRVDIIKQTLKAIDKLLPKYFPDGPYQRKDLLAIAMIESAFDKFLTGGHGEYGIFQIMPESCEWMGVTKNQFEVEVNTELALFVLKKKFDEHKNYKLAIIGYNGIVKRRGKIDETYWNKFIKYRRALDDILQN